MSCLVCASGNQAEFTAEINIHLSGLGKIDVPVFCCFLSYWFAWIAAPRVS